MSKSDMEHAMARGIADAFLASGIQYTCDAVIIDFIGPTAHQLSDIAANHGKKIKPRRLQNLTIAKIREAHGYA